MFFVYDFFRLEKIIQKSAVEYYTSEASFLKRQLDNVNRQTQLKLLIRRHFQIGYLNEFAEKKGKSLKHYTLAYNYIKEIKKTRTEIDEMKVMADFINYKVWMARKSIKSQNVPKIFIFTLALSYLYGFGSSCRCDKSIPQTHYIL
jgi:hypothetical protein